MARLTDFDHRLNAMRTSTLGAQASFDFRNLRAGIRREIFRFEEMAAYTRNPMTYAGALDVSPYIKRDFAPLDERVRGIIGILNQAPAVLAAGRANLEDSLPKPLVETAIEVGNGSADFLEKDLVDALKDLKDAGLRAEFNAADQRAAVEMRGFVKFLKEEKLPKTSSQFALGRENFSKMLREGELITQSPEEILQIGLAELRREQALFAETAVKIDASRKAIDVFNEIQSDHPTAQGLIPDTRKDLEAIRTFVVDHHIVTIPSEVRPRVEETRCRLIARSSFCLRWTAPARLSPKRRRRIITSRRWRRVGRQRRKTTGCARSTTTQATLSPSMRFIPGIIFNSCP